VERRPSRGFQRWHRCRSYTDTDAPTKFITDFTPDDSTVDCTNYSANRHPHRSTVINAHNDSANEGPHSDPDIAAHPSASDSVTIGHSDGVTHNYLTDGIPYPSASDSATIGPTDDVTHNRLAVGASGFGAHTRTNRVSDCRTDSVQPSGSPHILQRHAYVHRLGPD